MDLRQYKRDFKQEIQEVDERYRYDLNKYISSLLNKFDKDKIMFSYSYPVVSDEYADWINYVTKEGNTLVYNNEDCDGYINKDGTSYGLAYGEEQQIWDMDMEVLFNIAGELENNLKKIELKI